MQKNSIIRACGLLVLILIFIFGLFQLFVLVFKTGDIYPAYSSLRSDPLGTRALYESLKKFDHIAVQRNYRLGRDPPQHFQLALGHGGPQGRHRRAKAPFGQRDHIRIGGIDGHLEPAGDPDLGIGGRADVLTRRLADDRMAGDAAAELLRHLP